MKLSHKKHHYDFTVEHYRELLQIAKSEYEFRFFDEIDIKKRIMLWRHDLDLSVHRAVRLARIEAREGVKGSYFVHLHSRFYNWSEKEVTDKLHEIRSLGHKIGLHFDPAFYEGRLTNTKDIRDALIREKESLEDEFNQQIDVFSIHNPESCRDWCQDDTDRIAGMINVYSQTLKDNFTYCSDSNGYWRFRRLYDVLVGGEYARLHVLTHPGWWQEYAMRPRKRIERCIEGRAEKVRYCYDKFLENQGRMNI